MAGKRTVRARTQSRPVPAPIRDLLARVSKDDSAEARTFARLVKRIADAGFATPEATRARRLGERAYFREWRRLQVRAAQEGGDGARSRQAVLQLHRALILRHLDRIGAPGVRPRVSQRRSGPVRRPLRRPQRRAGRPRALVGVPPEPPTGVSATAYNGSARLRWSAPTSSGSAPLLHYVVTPFRAGVAQATTTVPPLMTDTLVGALTNGAQYTFKVQAQNVAQLTSPMSDPSAPVTPTAPGVLGDFQPSMPGLSSKSLLDLGAEAELRRELLQAAGRTASKWRYEHLREQAKRAANDALGYEQYIAQLMAMEVEKVVGAEHLLSPTLLHALGALQGGLADLSALGSSVGVQDTVDDVASAAAQALLLQRLILWLIQTSPTDFWIGLFDAMIDDVSALPNEGFRHTKAYIDRTFANDIDGIRAAVDDAVAKIESELDAEVDRLIAPIREAVQRLIGETSEAMQEVFQSFDQTLLIRPSEISGAPDVPNVDPLTETYDQLETEVQKLADQMKAELRTKLAAAQRDDLFRKIVLTYLCVPILAVLSISVSGGPIAAGVIIGITLLALQELIHLLARWLSGPLMDKVREAREKVARIVRQLQDLFQRQAAVMAAFSPTQALQILSQELRELRTLLPEAFLRDAAELLSEARDVVLREAIDLALGAEQAVGHETGTAYDAIAYRYDTGLAVAPQLPGGDSSTLLAGAALLRDIGRLEQQRIALADGKDLEVTHRLSLVRLLGGDPSLAVPGGRYPELLANGEGVVHLREEDVIDATFPGLYRCLIKEIRVTGVLAQGIAGASSLSVPVTVTHLGESRTRIKRGVNPKSPPIELPRCAPEAGALPQRQQFIAGFIESNLIWRTVWEAMTKAWLERRFTGGEGEEAWLRAVYQFANITDTLRDAVVAIVPDELGRKAAGTSCGVVEPARIAAAARRLLQTVDWPAVIPSCQVQLSPFTRINCPDYAYITDTSIDPIVTALREDQVGGTAPDTYTIPGLRTVAGNAYDDGVARIQERIGKWGGAYIEEDPDPHVRSLGFTTLVRPAPPESAVYNLLTAPPGAAIAPPSPDGDPLSPPGTLQYRPFENRSLGGRLQVRLPAGISVASLPDIFVDVTLRACYDESLAATVRSSRDQIRRSRALLSSIVPATTNLIFAGTSPRVDVGLTDMRTVHYSLRAHRDRTLQVYVAAVEDSIARTGAPPPAPPVGTWPYGALANVRPLGPSDAFEPLPGAALQFVLRLEQEQPVSEQRLLNLATTITVSDKDLGFIAGLVPDATGTTAQPALVGVGIGVIPMPAGVKLLDASGAVVANPLAPTVKVSSVGNVIDGLIPGFSGPNGAALGDRIRITSNGVAPVPFGAIWGAGDSATIEVDFSGAMPPTTATPRLYDVVFSLTYRMPALEAAVALPATLA
jgi:hypothetical protein